MGVQSTGLQAVPVPDVIDQARLFGLVPGCSLFTALEATVPPQGYDEEYQYLLVSSKAWERVKESQICRSGNLLYIHTS